MVIRPLVADGIGAWLELVDGAAESFGMVGPTPEAKVRLANEVVAQNAHLSVIVAAVDDQPIGYACYYLGFTSFKATGVLHLEDLFVLADYRGRGIGRDLLRACAAAAIERDCIRVEWLVQTSNPRAIEFYKRLGSKVYEEFRLCSLDGAEMRAIAG